ncbi:SufE family protein [Pseudomonas akapageensis]|uniref:SufE family protein n=1 Tax=Pseudomonas akapageensis TaxID=2609961 RepID=UPI00140AF625|nr:SufE family protein [Pseudomonas akapageensis]
MSLSIEAQGALETFQQAAGWEQRARLLMQWGDRLTPLNEAEKTADNLVHGCESQVWLTAREQDGRWLFTASSDARLLRGLLALLLVRVNGTAIDELEHLDLPDWFNQLGLGRQLSPSRSNGLNAVLQRMRQLVAGA